MLTDPARTVFQLADEEARKSRAVDAGSMDILRAMLEVENSIAQYALIDCGVSVKVFDDFNIDSIHGSDRSFETLYEYALQEVEVLRHRYIGTEHLLLAVASDQHCRGAKFLDRIDSDDLRLVICKTVIAVLGNSWRKWIKHHSDAF